MLPSHNGNCPETEGLQTPTLWGSVDKSQKHNVQWKTNKQTNRYDKSANRTISLMQRWKQEILNVSPRSRESDFLWGEIVTGRAARRFLRGLVMFLFWMGCGFQGCVHLVKIYWAVGLMICALSCIVLYFNKKFKKIIGLNAGSICAKWWVSALLYSLWWHPLE